LQKNKMQLPFFWFLFQAVRDKLAEDFTVVFILILVLCTSI